MKYALTRKRYLQCSLKFSAFEHVLATSEKKNIFLAYVREMFLLALITVHLQKVTEIS